MWRAWWCGGACGGISAGPRGLSSFVSFVVGHCTLVLHLHIVFLQWNPAIKLLCNDVDIVLVYLVHGDVLFCCYGM